MTPTVPVSGPQPPTSVAGGRLAKIAAFESGIWRSLWRWVFRRPLRLEPGARAFSYAAAGAPLVWVFVGLSAVEIPIVDLLLPSLKWRLIGLGVGAWALLWMLGLLGSLYVYPHVVEEQALRIRNSLTVDITVPLDSVESIRVSKRTVPGTRTLEVEETKVGPIVQVAVSSQLDVEVMLRQTVTVVVPKVGPVEAVGLRFYADDPKALVSFAQQQMDAADSEF